MINFNYDHKMFEVRFEPLLRPHFEALTIKPPFNVMIDNVIAKHINKCLFLITQ